jgi:DNA-binding Lrp family transcriptional regulator
MQSRQKQDTGILSAKDQKILGELKKNSRETIRNIAKKTGLRPSTVHQRIQKLEKDGTIEKYTLKISKNAAGENFVVYMLVQSGKNIEPHILSSPNIKEVYGITGEYDLLFKMKFKDVDSFNSFLLKFREAKGIKKTLTMVATVEIKEEF